MENEKVTTTPAESVPENDAEKKPKKKRGLRNFLIFLLAVVLVWWFNNFTIKTTRAEILSSKINSTVKIAVISDFHAPELGVSSNAVIKRIEKESPDMVVILGDMYTLGSSHDDIDIALELMYGIKEKVDLVYFAPGEHDYYDPEINGSDSYYYDRIRSHGIKIMNYKNEVVEINGNKFQIMGIDNVHYTSTFDLTREFTVMDDCFNILLAHIPNYEKFSAFGADLTICADTHGGIVQLPFDKGPLYSSEYGCWFPQIGQDKEVYDKGIFPYEGGAMFITSGLGDSPVPLRFNNRPEVAILEIRSR